MGRALRKRLAGFDIVHLHSVFLWPTLAAARIARNRQIPFVLSPRGMLAPDLIRQKSPFLKTAWIELFERRTIRDAAALHVTSQIEAEDLERFNFRLPPVWVTPNGVELPELDKASSTVSEDVRRAVSGGPFVLALGRICWKKNLLGLVDAIATIPGLRCVIAGNSEDDHASDVRRRIAERGVEDRTIILDRLIDGRDKWCLYRSCSVFALPSHHENFGNVALEAMAFCKPVVVSSRAGVASVVVEAGAGTVVEPETEALARAVAALMASPDQREAHGKAGGLAVEERYGWRRIASEMMGHYRTIADRRS
jgi:glycosyltransferase involved in cell wall biosynthesis